MGEVLRSITVQPSTALETSPPSPRQTCSTSLPPGSERRIVRQLLAISSSEALSTPSAASRLSGASSRSAASTFRPLLRARLRHIGSPMGPTPINPIMSAMSVHDEEFGAAFGPRTVRQGPVGHLIALALLQHHGAAVGQFGVQFAFQHQEHVALLAPVVGKIARRVFHHAHADVVEGLGAPVSLAGLAGVLGALHAIPICRPEGYFKHQHGLAFSTVCARRYAARRRSWAKAGSSTLLATTMPPTHRATSDKARSRASGPARSACRRSSSFSRTS